MRGATALGLEPFGWVALTLVAMEARRGAGPSLGASLDCAGLGVLHLALSLDGEPSRGSDTSITVRLRCLICRAGKAYLEMSGKDLVGLSNSVRLGFRISSRLGL